MPFLSQHHGGIGVWSRLNYHTQVTGIVATTFNKPIRSLFRYLDSKADRHCSETCLVRPPLERTFSNSWKLISTIGFHAKLTCLERPSVWNDHVFVTSRMVVLHKFHYFLRLHRPQWNWQSSFFVESLVLTSRMLALIVYVEICHTRLWNVSQGFQ